MSEIHPIRRVPTPYRLSTGPAARPFLQQAGPVAAARPTPAYKEVLSWILLLPLLLLVANGSWSLTNPNNSTFMTENASLVQTQQGIRPQVVFYLFSMLAFTIAGYRGIWRVMTRNRLLLFAPVFALLSLVWSPAPVLTFRTCVELALTTCFAFYLTQRMSTEKLMNLLMFVGVVTAVLSIFLALFVPQYGIFARYSGGAWQGICSHKNTLGVSLAFLLTPVFFVKKRLELKLAYSALLLFVIAMSQSRGAWFVTIAVLLFIAWLPFFKRMKGSEALVVTATTAILIVAMAVFVYLNLEPFMRAIGKDPTLSGRTGIYDAVVTSIFKHPLLGYGFGAFWSPANPEAKTIGLSIHWINIGYAENGILELWLEIGTIGLGLVLLTFWNAIKQGVQLVRSTVYAPRVGWFCSLIFLELITNIEAGAVLAPVTLNWTMTLIAFVGLADEMRKQAGSLSTR